MLILMTLYMLFLKEIFMEKKEKLIILIIIHLYMIMIEWKKNLEKLFYPEFVFLKERIILISLHIGEKVLEVEIQV